jgi:segregation and condensation protein A
MASLAIAVGSTPEARSYDGPFDVLLALIRRNEYPIDALPVGAITAQFREYVRSHDMDQDLGGEFVETASWLVLLKSRSLLPAAAADDSATPQEELRRALLDYQAVKAAAAFLGEHYPHAGSPKRPAIAEEEFNDPVPPTLADLLESARRAVEVAHAANSLAQSAADDLTLESQMDWISEQLRQAPASTAVSAAQWFAAQPSASTGALLFLGLLELARKGQLILFQSRDFAEIMVKAL